MSYMEMFIELFSNTDSPFSDATTSNLLNIGDILGTLGNVIWMFLGKGLAAFLDAMSSFANACYNWLSFSNSSIVTELYDVLSKWIVIPLAIGFIIIAFKYATGDVNKSSSKQYMRNIVVVIMFMCFMPSIFSYINNTVIGTDFLNGMTGNSNQSMADTILKESTKDYYYLYQESSLQTTFSEHSPNEDTGQLDSTTVINDLKTLQKDYDTSSYSSTVTFDGLRFDVNSEMKDSDGFTCPEFFKYKVSEKKSNDGQASGTSFSNSELYSVEQMDTSGILGTGIGATYYKRYSVDFVNLMIQLLASAIMYFCIGYSVLKLIFELIIHQVFGSMMAAMDISGGQRVKKYLSAILGCYMGLLVSSMIVMLYSHVGEYLETLNITGLTKSLILICLAIIFLDGPNVIAKYFGVNTGVRGGMMLAGAGAAMAGKAAKRVGHTATAPLRAGANLGRSAVSTAVGDKVRGQINAPKEAAKKQEAMQKEAHNVAERNAQNTDRYNNQVSDYKKEHGTDGNYEKYENPTKVDAENKTPEENKDALTQRAGLESSNNDFYGKESDVDQLKNGALNNTGYNEVDKNAMNDVTKADINDAKHGMYKGIANKAEANGGKRDDYVAAAKESVSAIAPNEKNKDYVGYVADSSMNAQHAGEIRTQAKNIKAVSGGKKNDVECYSEAMQSSGYGFDKVNCDKIAKAEIRDNGSLASGNIYDKRPKKPYEFKTNSQTSALK